MECDLGQGRPGHDFRMRVSIGFLGLSSLLTPCLAISDDTKSIFSGCCCKLGLILFPFLLVARLCCLWKTSMLVIKVTLRISCRLRGRRHLKFAGSTNCFLFLDCRGGWRFKKLSKAPQSMNSTYSTNMWALLPDPKHLTNSMRVVWRKASSPKCLLIHNSTVFSFQDSLVISSVVWNPTFHQLALENQGFMSALILLTPRTGPVTVGFTEIGQ